MACFAGCCGCCSNEQANDFRIKQIETNGSHALAIDANNDVYSIGLNNDGQLGVGDYLYRSTWTKVVQMPGAVRTPDEVTKVQVGYRSSAILTKRGDVYVMGNGLFCGGPCFIPQWFNLPNVAEISLRNRHILALTEDNEVWAWGDNGQGRNDPKAINKNGAELTCVAKGRDRFRILQIDAGHDMSLIRWAAKNVEDVEHYPFFEETHAPTQTPAFVVPAADSSQDKSTQIMPFMVVTEVTN